MKKVLLAFAAFFIVFGAVYFLQNFIKNDLSFPIANRAKITINNQNFNLTVSKTEREREKGLSDTKSMPVNQGMLFVFDNPGYYPFWMKNMKFPIDIIFINKDTIVSIEKNAKVPKDQENPEVFNPIAESDKVLEINAGLSDKYNFKIGDKVNIEGI